MEKYQVSDATRRNALVCGDAAIAWLGSLPELVSGIERDWGLTVMQSLAGATEAYVALARLAGGGEAILRVDIPGLNPDRRAMHAFREAVGRGYAALLDCDEAREAMLLERLGGSLSESGLSVARQLEIVCETLGQAWRVPGEPQRFQSGADKARSLSRFIDQMRSDLPGRVSDAAAERAQRFCARREAAFDPARAVMAHGDGHADNTLAVPGEPGAYKFVDPKGLFIEPEFDLGVLMRGWSAALLDGDPAALGLARLRRLADLTGLDEAAIWEWGFVERLASGLHCENLGMKTWAASFLRVAEAWTDV